MYVDAFCGCMYCFFGDLAGRRSMASGFGRGLYFCSSRLVGVGIFE